MYVHSARGLLEGCECAASLTCELYVDGAFTQQNLPACKLVLSPRLVLSCLLCAAVVFIPIGIATLVAARSVKQVSVRYDDVCFDKDTQGPWYQYMEERNWECQTDCSVTLFIKEEMKAPVYVYYRLENFYQNHRRYVSSRSYVQLQGLATGAKSECDPIEYVGGNRSLPITPCGLTAWSNFNDTYELESVRNGSVVATIDVSDEGIAWKADMDRAFGDVEPENFNTEEMMQYRGGAPIRTQYINQDERFLNWMRLSTFPTFRKLWGRIETDIAAGTEIRVNVTNCYNSYRINGKKYVSLSTASWIGGDKMFLPITFIAVGSVCGAAWLFFGASYLMRPRKLGDSRVLSWNRKG